MPGGCRKANKLSISWIARFSTETAVSTMLVRGGQIQHFHDHQRRVDDCLKALRISALDWDVVNLWLDNALQHIKITIFMGQRALMVQRIFMIKTSLIMKIRDQAALAVEPAVVATVPRVSPSQR